MAGDVQRDKPGLLIQAWGYRAMFMSPDREVPRVTEITSNKFKYQAGDALHPRVSARLAYLKPWI